MKNPRQIALLLTLATTIAVNVPLSALALNSAEERLLSAYEVQLFGKARPQMSEDARLRGVETSLFGQPKGGDAESRLDAVSKLMGKTIEAKQNGLNPPIAAQYDRSEFAPQPKATPAAVSPGAHAEQAPPKATDSDTAKELLRTALAKHAEGKTAEAERIFKQVLRVDPSNTDANFSLGTLAEQRGDLSGAARFYKIASASNPSDLEIQDALTAIQNKMRNQQVAQQQAQQKAQEQQISAQRKNELRALAEQAATAYKAGDFDSAIAKVSKVAAAEPQDANAQFALAQAWRGKGDYNRAQGYLSAALAIDPGNSLYQTTMRDMQQEGQQRVQQQMAQQDSRPQGEITPFAPDNRGGGAGGGLRGGLAGMFGGGNNDAADYGPDDSGSPAYGWSGGNSSGGYAYSSSGRSRIGSAMAGGLMGAAVGAFTGRGTAGGVKQGMIQGGLMGAMMGLIRN